MKREEFERLALDELDHVHRAAFQLCRDHATAADLVQDTYLRAVRSAHTFEDRGSGIRPWLYSILHNVFYSHLKKEQRAPLAVETVYGADHRETPPGEPPPAWDLNSLDWDYVDEGLKEALDSLDADSRMILLLWGVEGMKYREIAEIMTIPVGTVMSRLHRARKKVMDHLEHRANAPAPGQTKP